MTSPAPPDPPAAGAARPQRRWRTWAAALAGLALGVAWFWPALWPEAPAPTEPPLAQAAPPVAGPAAEPATRGPVVEAPNGEDTQAVPQRPTQSVARQQGLHRAADPLGLHSSAALLVDAASGRELAGKNADAVLPVASLTKLMTALLMAESRLPLDEPITITEDDVDHERHSRSRLRVGTRLTRAEALHLALMSSENRAAHALGRTFPGGLDAFVAAMNARARSLGMAHTHYVDPTGLSTRNQSTARDLAVLARAASQHPLIRAYSTTPRHALRLGQRTLVYNNSNRLVKRPEWNIVLQKTGYIVEAGQCVAMRFRAQDRDLIVVLLDAQDKRSRSADAERVRRWALGDAGAPPARHAEAVKPRTGGRRAT